MNHRRILSLAVLVTTVCLLSQSSLLEANAPESLRRKSYVITVAAGGGTFDSYGTYELDFFVRSDTVHRLPLSPNVEEFEGAYSYSKVSANQAQMTITENDGTVVTNLVFYGPSVAVFSIDSSAGYQRGTVFEVDPSQQAGEIAPTSITGYSVMGAVASGNGSYSSVGGFRLILAANDNTYALLPFSPEIIPSAGTYSYSKTGPATASVTLNDSGGLVTTTQSLRFVSPTTAVFTVSDGNGEQFGIISVGPKDQPVVTKLVNLSVRTVVPASSSVIPGFVIEGTEKQTVLIRAGGPALAGFTGKPAMEDPVLTVYSGAQPIASNDDWSSVSQNKEECITAGNITGAFPYLEATTDAAIVVTLDPGPYTVKVSGKDEAGGEVLLEVYGVPAN